MCMLCVVRRWQIPPLPCLSEIRFARSADENRTWKWQDFQCRFPLESHHFHGPCEHFERCIFECTKNRAFVTDPTNKNNPRNRKNKRSFVYIPKTIIEPKKENTSRNGDVFWKIIRRQIITLMKVGWGKEPWGCLDVHFFGMTWHFKKVTILTLQVLGFFVFEWFVFLHSAFHKCFAILWGNSCEQTWKLSESKLLDLL